MNANHLARALILLLAGLLASEPWPGNTAAAAEPDLVYVELEGTAEGFRDFREWRSYYWRDDFTFVLCDDSGKRQRVISREPTPWTNLRLGTTYTGLKFEWAKNPRVKVVGVQGIDRTPAEFYDLKLDPRATVTAFILRVRDTDGVKWQDYYVNNWFHRWGKETDAKVLAHYANDDLHYSVYGYLGGIAAPFDAAGQKLLENFSSSHSGIIYHARVAKAENDAKNKTRYELHVLHLMGRHKKTANYEVFYGDGSQLRKLDQRKP
jgi:hypothetical protein